MADLNLLQKFQFALAAGVLTDVYTCPVGRTTEVTIHLCNREAADTTFRIAVAIEGAVDAVKQYYYYDAKLYANNSFRSSYVLNENDVIRVQVASALVSVNVSVDESEPLAT